MADQSSWGVLAPYKKGAAATSAEHAESPGSRRHFYGARSRQRRAHLVAVHHRQVRSEFFVPFVAGLLTAVSRYLRDRPLYRAHRRKHLSGLYSFAAPLRVFSLDLDDAFLSLVRRLRCRRRHFVGGADEFSGRLVGARPNAFLGLYFDVGVPRRYSTQQSHLSARGSIHVGRRATHVGGAAVGQCRGTAC